MKNITLIAFALFLFQLTLSAQFVTFKYTTITAEGAYSPKHVLAVWIEDGKGNFIKSLKVMGVDRKKYLYTWNAKSAKNEVDAVSGATLTSHTPDSVSWDCRDVNQKFVADGKYTLAIEYTDQHKQGPVYRAGFTKGTKPFSLKFPDQEYFKNMVLDFSLKPKSEAPVQKNTEKISDHLGEMITVPEGNFIMGNDNGSWEERPQHLVYLPTYQIGKYEATRGEYRKFIEAGGYNDPQYWSADGWVWKEGNVIVYAGMYGDVSYTVRKNTETKRNAPEHWEVEQEWIGHEYGHPRFVQTDKHPVVGVTYYEAEAYCKWAGGRLPTEAEYEKAARWTGSHSNLYPYGDTWDPEKSNNPEDHNPAGGGFEVNQSAPVGSYPAGASPYGCMDMAGNAYEWCADFAKSYPGSSKPFDYTGKYHVVKGGCWDDPEISCAFRSWYLPRCSGGVGPGDSDIIGFRIAK